MLKYCVSLEMYIYIPTYFFFCLFPGYGDPPPMTPREFDMGLPCLNVEENQFLQLTAVDRCNSRLSAVYAEGST